jgi:hypothetical protein
VCFFVLCNGHWFNRVPGPVTNLGIASLPFALNVTLAVPGDLQTACCGPPSHLGESRNHLEPSRSFRDDFETLRDGPRWPEMTSRLSEIARDDSAPQNHLGPSRSISKSSRAISESFEVISGHLPEMISRLLTPTPNLIGCPSQHRGGPSVCRVFVCKVTGLCLCLLLHDLLHRRTKLWTLESA